MVKVHGIGTPLALVLPLAPLGGLAFITTLQQAAPISLSMESLEITSEIIVKTVHGISVSL
jgi:hypothetical protein